MKDRPFSAFALQLDGAVKILNTLLDQIEAYTPAGVNIRFFGGTEAG
jgi:hypothetical protein